MTYFDEATIALKSDGDTVQRCILNMAMALWSTGENSEMEEEFLDTFSLSVSPQRDTPIRVLYDRFEATAIMLATAIDSHLRNVVRKLFPDTASLYSKSRLGEAQDTAIYEYCRHLYLLDSCTDAYPAAIDITSESAPTAYTQTIIDTINILHHYAGNELLLEVRGGILSHMTELMLW